jgi:hypothetical protein
MHRFCCATLRCASAAFWPGVELQQQNASTQSRTERGSSLPRSHNADRTRPPPHPLTHQGGRAGGQTGKRADCSKTRTVTNGTDRRGTNESDELYGSGEKPKVSGLGKVLPRARIGYGRRYSTGERWSDECRDEFSLCDRDWGPMDDGELDARNPIPTNRTVDAPPSQLCLRNNEEKGYSLTAVLQV